MGWTTKYTGPQIDEALEKGRNLRITNNGWIRLVSTASDPIDLGALKNPGNYMALFWTDGPDIGVGNNFTPINIVVIIVNNVLYQFVDVYDKKYCRYFMNETNTFSPWRLEQISGSLNVSPVAPTNAVEEKTVWLDTSIVSTPILKLYTSNGWVEIVTYNAMLTTIYDTTGKKTDIFKYIDDAITAASFGASVEDFRNHIANGTIHVTTADKEKWNNSANKDDVTAAMDGLKPSIDDQVTAIVNAKFNLITTLTTVVGMLQEGVNTHVNDTTMHPSKEQQIVWDSKSPGDHTHNLDGKVTVDPDHIVGEIPTEKLPYDVKERVYIVESLSQMHALTKNPIHNGDTIYVDDGSGSWYFLIDDTKLHIDIMQQGTISSTSRSWNSVCYGNDKFVAIARDGHFAYSTDGVTWTEGTISSTSRVWQSVCYGNDKFVAVANAVNSGDSEFAYSTDGINWTEGTILNRSNSFWSEVCYGNGKFVAVLYGFNLFAYSTDGINWTTGKIGSTSSTWYTVCYGNGKFVAVGTNYISAYSTDGITWTEGTMPNSGNWRPICYGKDKFVTIAYNSNLFAYSYDGITWIEGTISSTSRSWSGLCYGNDKFVAVAEGSNIFAYSTDGITWIESIIDGTGGSWRSVCYGNGKFVAVAGGAGSNIFAYADSNLNDPSLAFKKLSSVSNIYWSDIKNTPNTLSGYGIMDAATSTDIAAIRQIATEVKSETPENTDLSAVFETQTTYNELLRALNDIDTTLASLDAAITTLEEISS